MKILKSDYGLSMELHGIIRDHCIGNQSLILMDYRGKILGKLSFWLLLRPPTIFAGSYFFKFRSLRIFR